MAVAVVPLVLASKLAAGCHIGNWKLLSALACPFLLKISLVGVGLSFNDLAFSLRLFVFRLHQIFGQDGAARRSGDRWERVVRLCRERVSGGRRGAAASNSHINVNTLSMVSLMSV